MVESKRTGKNTREESLAEEAKHLQGPLLDDNFSAMRPEFITGEMMLSFIDLDLVRDISCTPARRADISIGGVTAQDVLLKMTPTT